MPHQAPTYEQLLAELERVRAHCGRLAADDGAAADDDFRAVFRASSDILLLLTPDYTMVEASDARLKATSTTREGTIGRHLFEVFPDSPANEEAGQANLDASLKRVLKTRQPHEMALQRYDLALPDGTFEERWWRPVNTPVLGPDGAVRYIIHRVEDATADKRLESSEAVIRRQLEDLRQMDQLKDQFLGILSHELRTPINAIMGFSSVLADGLAGELSHEQARFIGKILDSTDALLGLVNDLLDMSRVQAGKFALDVQTVGVASLVGDVLADLAADAVQKGLAVVNEVPPNLPHIKADAQRVGQVLANLVTNAIKYTPEGGTITLRACVRGASLRVEVSDTGLGVSPNQQSRIFQPFTQVDMTSTRAKGGVGLGLSIVKALVEAHGGEVGVVSEGEGRGSTFFFTLPLAPG